MVTDAEILARHDVSVRPRVRMELAIVNAIIRQAKATRRILTVWSDGENITEGDVKAAVFAVDECVITVSNAASGIREGGIYIVLGNDGWDCISDYHVSLEQWLAPVEALADALENGLA